MLGEKRYKIASQEIVDISRKYHTIWTASVRRLSQDLEQLLRKAETSIVSEGS
jgi:ATP-dependent Lon protease